MIIIWSDFINARITSSWRYRTNKNNFSIIKYWQTYRNRTIEYRILIILVESFQYPWYWLLYSFILFLVFRPFVWSKSTFEWNNEVNAKWSISNGIRFYFRLFKFSAHLFEEDPFIVIFGFTSLRVTIVKFQNTPPKRDEMLHLFLLEDLSV